MRLQSQDLNLRCLGLVGELGNHFELLYSAEKVNEIQPVRGSAPAPAPAKSLTPRPGSLSLPGKVLPSAGGTALKLVKTL